MRRHLHRRRHVRLTSAAALGFAVANAAFAHPAFAQDPTTSPSDPATAAPSTSPSAEPTTPAQSAPAPSADVSTPQVGMVERAPLRPIRFTGSLGAISLPRILSLEVLARFRKKDDPKWDLFAVGAGIEYLPPGLANFGEDTTLSWFQVGADARFFAYRWLFVGARLGYQFARADSEKFGSEVDYVTTAFILAPKVGALYTFDSGFTIGADLGASIPIAPDTSITSDGTQDSNARKASKTFGMFVMPSLSLRVGWTI